MPTTSKKPVSAKARPIIVLDDEVCERPWGLGKILSQFAGQVYVLDTVVQAYAQALQGKAAQKDVHADVARAAQMALEALPVSNFRLIYDLFLLLGC